MTLALRWIPRVLALTLTVACTTRKDAGTTHDTSAGDSRAPVVLPADGRRAVLNEMRQMLAAMGAISAAAARGDTTALLAAIAPAGSAAAADPELEALLPAKWKELAEQTHGGFDELAASVRRARTGAAVKDTVLTRLAQLTGSCNSCHSMYRLTR